MSHFSKIKTSISNIKILKKTLDDLGLSYKSQNYLLADKSNVNSQEVKDNLVVFAKGNQIPLCMFNLTGQDYNLVVDIALWHFNMSIDCFLEKLHQRYALNAILDKSISNGFLANKEILMTNGSLKLTIHKWIS